MIRTVVIGAVVALIFGAATAIAFQQTAAITVSVDLNTEGNSGTAVGTIDTCRSVNPGDTFQIDITVQGVPTLAPDGKSGAVAAFGYNFHYDPKVLNVTADDNSLKLGSSLFEYIQANYVAGGAPNPFPSTSGDLRVDVVDLSPIFKAGDGVLSRLTIQAVGPGQSTITLDDEVESGPEATLLQPGQGVPYDFTNQHQQNALVTVGQPCSGAPTLFVVPTPVPTASATPGPSQTPAATPIPIGETKLAVDAVTTGNEATKLGQIDDCASADLNEVFQVDVVIQGVTNLLAWELPISFDPTVLRVEDRDVKLFQAANTGSQVFDSSNQTPNDTGTYIASAFDAADPPAPDSGSGVLVRFKLTAIGSGTSQLSLAPIDLNNDGQMDKGVLLRPVSGSLIGDTNHDTFFDGPATSAEIHVGSSCPNGGKVVAAQANSTGSLGSSSGGSSNTWIWIVAGVVAAVVVLGLGGLALVRRRRGRSNVPPASDIPPSS